MLVPYNQLLDKPRVSFVTHLVTPLSFQPSSCLPTLKREYIKSKILQANLDGGLTLKIAKEREKKEAKTKKREGRRECW